MSEPAAASQTAAPAPAAAAAPLLEVDGLTVRLRAGGAMQPVLRDVSVTIRAGEALGLVG